MAYNSCIIIHFIEGTPLPTPCQPGPRNDIAQFEEAEKDWLASFVELPNLEEDVSYRVAKGWTKLSRIGGKSARTGKAGDTSQPEGSCPDCRD